MLKINSEISRCTVGEQDTILTVKYAVAVNYSRDEDIMTPVVMETHILATFKCVAMASSYLRLRRDAMFRMFADYLRSDS